MFLQAGPHLVANTWVTQFTSCCSFHPILLSDKRCRYRANKYGSALTKVMKKKTANKHGHKQSFSNVLRGKTHLLAARKHRMAVVRIVIHNINIIVDGLQGNSTGHLWLHRAHCVRMCITSERYEETLDWQDNYHGHTTVINKCIIGFRVKIPSPTLVEQLGKCIGTTVELSNIWIL